MKLIELSSTTKLSGFVESDSNFIKMSHSGATLDEIKASLVMQYNVSEVQVHENDDVYADWTLKTSKTDISVLITPTTVPKYDTL